MRKLCKICGVALVIRCMLALGVNNFESQTYSDMKQGSWNCIVQAMEFICLSRKYLADFSG